MTPRASRRWRALVDAGRLVWPVVGGYRVLLPRVLDRASRTAWTMATAYRRRVVRRTVLVAVVGSLGKTTTARTTAAVLGTSPPPQAGNFGVRLALTMLRVRPWHRYAVIEAGISGPDQMAPAASMLAPDIAVVTSIRSDHHRSFATIEQKRDEKAAMVRALPAHGVAVLNGDDPHVRWMASQTAARVVTFGLGDECDVRGTDIRGSGASGTEFTVHVDGETHQVRTRLLGTHMVLSALAALAVASARGRPIGAAVRALGTVSAPPGRLEHVELDSGVTLLNDAFKGSIESIVAALEAFATVPATRRVLVLGNIEEPEGSVRPICRSLGQRLALTVDRVILIGSDSLRSVVTGAEETGMDRRALTHVGSSIHDAIALLRDDLVPGDVVLVKGAGSQRLERIGLALAGRDVRCPVKVCQMPNVIRCAECPLLAHDEEAFDNVHVRRYVRL